MPSVCTPYKKSIIVRIGIETLPYQSLGVSCMRHEASQVGDSLKLFKAPSATNSAQRAVSGNETSQCLLIFSFMKAYPKAVQKYIRR